jgi:hypothetical protein
MAKANLAMAKANLAMAKANLAMAKASGSVSTKMSDKLQFVVALRQAKAYRTSN